MSQWSSLAMDYSGQAHLVNRQWPDCVLRLQGGPRMMLGPAVVEWITLDEQQWSRTDWRGDHTFIYYPSPADDPTMNFMIERNCSAGRSETGFFSCGHGSCLRNHLSWSHDLGLRDKNPVSGAMPEQ